MSVAEEGGEAQALGKLVMLGELRAVIEGDGLAQGGRQGFDQVQEAFEHGLAVFSEEHEINFPVAGVGAVVGLGRAEVNRHAVLQELHRTASLPAESATAGFAAGQQAVPVILLGGAVVGKSVDRLVTDQREATCAARPAGDLLGGPALLEVATHRGPPLRRGSGLVGSAPLAAARESGWARFRDNPDWVKLRDESIRKGGEIVRNISNRILTPASISMIR